MSLIRSRGYQVKNLDTHFIHKTAQYRGFFDVFVRRKKNPTKKDPSTLLPTGQKINNS